MSQHFSYTKLSHSIDCTCEDSLIRVLESRKSNMGKSIRRRRECDNCGARWTTYELHEDAIHELMRMAEKLSTLRTDFHQASQILQSLAERIGGEPLPTAEAQADPPAKAKVKKERTRAIHLKPIPAVEPPPRGCKGEALEAFTVVSDIESLDAELVARGQEQEWYMRQEVEGEYLWFKFAETMFPPVIGSGVHHGQSGGD
jgi:hypothetical protein